MIHGTATAYVTHKCRCDICRTWNRRYNKQLRLDMYAGRARLVDAGPAKQHVTRLLDAGWSKRGIVAAAGWKSRNSLALVMDADRINIRTARRILAITIDGDTRDNGYVDATGARRRLQALACMGYAGSHIAARLGHDDDSTVLLIRNGTNSTVRRRTAHAITALYDELSMTPGPSDRARRWAARQGWAPPLAWDDIDNPADTPDGLRKPGAGIDPQDVLELYQAGETTHAIAARFGIAPSSVHTLIGRARRQVAS